MNIVFTGFVQDNTLLTQTLSASSSKTALGRYFFFLSTPQNFPGFVKVAIFFPILQGAYFMYVF
jgi:hypothetical protein